MIRVSRSVPFSGLRLGRSLRIITGVELRRGRGNVPYRRNAGCLGDIELGRRIVFGCPSRTLRTAAYRVSQREGVHQRQLSTRPQYARTAADGWDYGRADSGRSGACKRRNAGRRQLWPSSPTWPIRPDIPCWASDCDSGAQLRPRSRGANVGQPSAARTPYLQLAVRYPLCRPAPWNLCRQGVGGVVDRRHAGRLRYQPRTANWWHELGRTDPPQCFLVP